jgi:hypothetical protein
MHSSNFEVCLNSKACSTVAVVATLNSGGDKSKLRTRMQDREFPTAMSLQTCTHSAQLSQLQRAAT